MAGWPCLLRSPRLLGTAMHWEWCLRRHYRRHGAPRRHVAAQRVNKAPLPSKQMPRPLPQLAASASQSGRGCAAAPTLHSPLGRIALLWELELHSSFAPLSPAPPPSHMSTTWARPAVQWKDASLSTGSGLAIGQQKKM